ncbi:MAG: hypothetical protein RID91_00150 [Azospirillaceae bacterium]
MFDGEDSDKGSYDAPGEQFPENGNDFASSRDAGDDRFRDPGVVIRVSAPAPGEMPRSRVLQRWRSDCRVGDGRRAGRHG